MSEISVGDTIKWNWGEGVAQGEVTRKFTSEITLTIKGTDVTRNATEDDPAFEIKQDDGDRVLKSASELSLN